ncbi:unnamed protein product, partial [Hymenolepis diminuta]
TSDNFKLSSKATRSFENDSCPYKEDYEQQHYSNISCTPAEEFFEKRGECTYGTDLMSDLENRFVQYVLKRREAALAVLPPVDRIRPPLKRPEIVERDGGTPIRLSKN